MLRLGTYLATVLFSGTLILQCEGQTTVAPGTPRYSTLLQNLAAATKARAVLEGQLKQYRESFETLKKAEQHDRDTCHCFDGPNVAFTAFLDKNVATFGAKQPLPFDNITLNAGNVYDPRHAAFTAPFDGVYQVFVTIATNAGYTLVVDILHNSTPITKLRTGNENQWHTATNGVIVHMRKGDDIWVEHSATGDSNRLYFGDGMITSFSGYLIHKD